MHKLSEYLPEKSEYAMRLERALEEHSHNLWVIGSAARRHVYNLKSGTDGYDFVFDDAEESFPESFFVDLNDESFTVEGAVNNWYYIDCESFDVYIRPERITDFLFGVAYAGDALAVNVSSGKPLVLPEYMALPPTTFIGSALPYGPQLAKEYVNTHLPVLKKFQDEVMSKLTHEPVNAN